jgi:hypothetical protein
MALEGCRQPVARAGADGIEFIGVGARNRPVMRHYTWDELADAALASGRATTTQT